MTYAPEPTLSLLVIYWKCENHMRLVRVSFCHVLECLYYFQSSQSLHNFIWCTLSSRWHSSAIFSFCCPPFSSCLCLDSLLVTEAEDWTMIQITEDTRTEVEARQSTTAANTDSSAPRKSEVSKMQAYVVLHWSCYIQSTYKCLYNELHTLRFVAILQTSDGVRIE